MPLRDWDAISKAHQGTFMISFLDKLNKSNVRATDGGIGSLVDMLVDDRSLKTEFAVIDTSAWLPDRRVLVPPENLHADEPHGVRVDLTQESIKSQPGLSTHLPVAAEGRAKAYNQYHWSMNPWGGLLGVPGASPPPADLVSAESKEGSDEPRNHLRSLVEMEDYHIQAQDGEVGHVEDYYVDSEDWNLRYLVVDTHNWLPGKKVVIPISSLQDISWPDRRVTLSLTCDEIKCAPTREDFLDLPKVPTTKPFAFLRGRN